MAKRKSKTRTHKKLSAEEEASIPKSMVLSLGANLNNHSLTQLVKDFRLVMSPHTAINLRERHSNKLKDFIVMCGPLGVQNLFIFNQNETGNLSLRLGKLPRGPMLQFQIKQYSLMKDVAKLLKHPKLLSKDGVEYMHPPLLVMNGFGKVNEAENHEKLLLTMFQNLFPPIQPQFTKLDQIRRVLMINKVGNDIEIRHYNIDTRLVDANKSIKRIINKKVPNLNKSEDISELVLDPYSIVTSELEVEEDAVVTTSEETSKSSGPTKKAIKLTELGPRISLSLVKIEEGLVGSSKTIYHSTITKTKDEITKLETNAMKKRKLKEERRAEQAANVAKKKVKLDVSESDNELDPDDYENDSDLFSD